MSDPGQEPRPPVRNMADIARLFLDGARPTPQRGAPQRVSPQSRNRPAPAPVPAPSPGPASAPVAPPPPAPARAQPIENQKSKIENTPTLPQVMLALSGTNSSPVTAQRLISAADALAQEYHSPVCVLSVEHDSFTIDIAGLESLEDLPALHFAAGAADMQIAHTLFTYRNAARHWILASPDSGSPVFARLAAAVPDWLVIAATDNESVIGSYRQLKKAFAAGAPAHPPRVVLCSNDWANAAVIHSRFRRAARDFLKSDLPLAAVARNLSASALRVAAIPVGGANSGNGDPSAVWSIILDELCGNAAEEIAQVPAESPHPMSLGLDDAIAQATAATAAAGDASAQADGAAAASKVLFDHLANVLDPEEREALAAGLYEDPLPVAPASPAVEAEALYDIRQQVASPHSGNPSTSPIENQKSKIENPTPALRAVDLTEEPAGRATQWQSIEQSVPDLIAEAIVLDARPPMSYGGGATESCLAADAAGCLHVWTLYKDGVSWFALREWANEHRSILALTRRDLPINREANVAVHIVMPLENDATKTDISTLLRTPAPDVFLYRLRTIQWQSRRGLVVVPIA